MKPATVQRIPVIDSHTAGEPTRVIVGGCEEPGGTTMAEKRLSFSRDFDWLRSAAVCEPRGHDAVVGALLCEPCEPDCVSGVIFFNNVGVLNGCLHGTMGVAVTLLYQGRIGPGSQRLDTPTGPVEIRVGEGGAVSVRNVRSYRARAGVEIAVSGHGRVRGDVAWGGNWFFLTDAPPGLPVTPDRVGELTGFARRVRVGLEAAGIRGDDGGEIDHIEVFDPAPFPELADSRNFVLCPGGAYDRSPCGTGTSAKLACLFDEGKLRAGERWRQAGILGTVFEGAVESSEEGGVIPTVSGVASITAEGTLIIDPAQLFAFGIPANPESGKGQS